MKRVYFLFGDLAAGSLVGLAAALACFYCFDADWPMLAAMFLGMLLGMVVALVLGLLGLYGLFGAMEVMLPTMLGGMLAGMIVSMAVAMGHLDAAAAALWGVVIGLATLCATYLANRLLSGRFLT
jgi:hypothetical protein